MSRISLNRLAVLAGAGDIFLQGITDIQIQADAAGMLAYTTTRPGGGVAVYRLGNAGSPARLNAASLPGEMVAGLTGQVCTVTLAGGTAVLATGLNGKGLWAAAVQADGSIGGTMTRLTTALPAGKLDLIVPVSAGADSLLCGSYLGSGQLTIWQADGTGALAQKSQLSIGAGFGQRGVSALSVAMAGAQPLVLAACDGAAALVSYRINVSTGQLTQAGRLDADSGLWVADPTALRVVTCAGQSYAILAAASSNSLTVVRIEANGGLVAVDHVIDNLNTRFRAAAQLECVDINGQIFVAVAGGDDGVSLFQLLPEGQLLHLTSLASTLATPLTAISALGLANMAGSLQLLVASTALPGLIVLKADPGPIGATLVGGALADTLTGGEGHTVLSGGGGNDLLIAGASGDILLDGAGADILRGGAGADVFVLAADGTPDVIQGFDAKLDQIDLSGWAFLRNLEQLTIHPTATGAEIRFLAEVLTLISVSNGPLDVATVLSLHLLDIDRLSPSWFGPPAVPPEDPESAKATSGPDSLTGTSGNDLLDALAGNDSLFGGAGDDTLRGGAGADVMDGGLGSDTYFVDDPGDRIAEILANPGVDLVTASVDFRMKGSHTENLTLTGAAVLGVGNSLANVITGNAGNNVLDGGKNNDTLIGGAGNDVYFIAAPGDTAVERFGEGIDSVKAFRSVLLGDNLENLYLQTVRTLTGVPLQGLTAIGNALSNTIVGNPYDNVLTGRGGNDTLLGQAGADTFVFDLAPAAGNADVIMDFATEDSFRLKGNLFGLASGALRPDALVFGATAQDSNDRIVYDQSTGRLWADHDGSGAGAAVLFATLANHAVLTAADFFAV